MTRPRALAAACALGTFVAVAYSAVSGIRSDSNVPSPATNAIVVAELFTSEGCSSCPPADALLSTLVQQRVAGVTVLGLSEHVDYWNRLGWRDPFSSATFTTRQFLQEHETRRTSGLDS